MRLALAAVVVAGCTWMTAITHDGDEPDPRGPCLQIVRGNRYLGMHYGGRMDDVFKGDAPVGRVSRETFDRAFADRAADRALMASSRHLRSAAAAVFAAGISTGVAIDAFSGSLRSEAGVIGVGTIIVSAVGAAALAMISDQRWSDAVTDYNDNARRNGCPQ